MLELKLLGSPQILLEGRTLPKLSAAKSQALLFYLALSTRPHSRLALAGLLWPEKSDSEALANLRQAVYHLRNALPNYLDITRLTIALNPDWPCQVDVVLFEKATNATDEMHTLQTAVDHYVGDFLAGFYVEEAVEFEEWMLVTRERLHHLATQILHQLAEHFDKHQETGLGLRYTNQWLVLEPWREEAHRQKMRFLAWDGQSQAALAHYAHCRQVLADELGAEPDAETVALFEQIRKGEIKGRGEPQQKTGRKAQGELNDTASAIHNLKFEIENRHDWGEMPDVRAFGGREEEARQLTQWLATERYRVVMILGMGGMGKTTLAAGLVPRLVDNFTCIIWRSLINAPPLADILRHWVQTLSAHSVAVWPTHLDAQLALLFGYLRQQPCLLVLDNVESILNDGASGEHATGTYRLGYEDYGQLLLRMGESQHRSSLLLTSRELPHEVARLEQKDAPIRLLHLRGLALDAGQRMLMGGNLLGSVAHQTTLLMRYSGNPLALQLIIKTIQDFFASDIAAFLADEMLLFADIREVLDQQFARLAPLEYELLLWLVIEREPVTLQTLQRDMAQSGSKSALFGALRSLQHRSLLEKTPAGFTLQNVIMEYATAYLIDEICREIETATPQRLHSHALLKAQAKEYVRQSQVRLFLQPVGERLTVALGQTALEEQLRHLLEQLRVAGVSGYAGGNILNLLIHLGIDLGGYDFSQLTIWQAYLARVNLSGVNFAQAKWRDTVFVNPFSSCEALTFAPDGHMLAGGTTTGEIHLWHASDGQLCSMIKAHDTTIWELVFSPDSQTLASASKDGTVRLWDVQTGQCRQVLVGHTDWVRAVAFHPAGRIIASGGHDQTVRLWDVRTGRSLHVLDKHTGWVMGLAFSPDGARLASASTDHTVRLWNIERLDEGEEWAILRGHSAGVEPILFSPDGALLVTGSIDKTIRVWDLAAVAQQDVNPCRFVLTGHSGAIYVAVFSPDGRRLFSAGHEPVIRMWDVATGQLLTTLIGHNREVNALAMSPDGALLASSETGNSSVYLWDLGVNMHTRQVLHGYRNWVNRVAFHPELPLLAGASSDGKVHLWDAATGQYIHMFRGFENNDNLSLAFGREPATEGSLMALGGADHTIRLWPVHLQGGTVTWVQPPIILRTAGEIHAVTFSHDGQFVISGGYDGAVRLWHSQTGQCLHTFHIEGDPRIKDVVMSADGQIIAAGSHNSTVTLWQVRTGERRHLHGHTEWAWTVAFHPGGQSLASGSFDRTVRLWDVNTGQLQQVLPQDSSLIQALAFSPDGAFLAAGTGEATIYLWDTRTLAQSPATPIALAHKLQGHTNTIQNLTFSSDSLLLASCSLDGAAKVWNMHTGKCLYTLHAPGPYTGMNITGATGITEAQKLALKALGALEM